MSLTSTSLFTSQNYQTHTTIINPPKTHLRNPKFALLLYAKPFLNPSGFKARKTNFLNFAKISSQFSNWAIQVKPLYLDGTIGTKSSYTNWDLNFDAFLSILEFFCLASSLAISVILAVNSGLPGHKKVFLQWFGERGLVWQSIVLVGGVIVGAIVRRRQWRRICEADFLSRPVNLVERIEKLEEDLKSSATVIRTLSRQFEKLGIRFRVTRKALKEPIIETAALAQKNSEATLALAMQGDILEKELGEIQKVLLAMQEQQQKQLELVLAIAKTGKLWDSKREENHCNNTAVASNTPVDGIPQIESNEVETLAGQKGSSNDQV